MTEISRDEHAKTCLYMVGAILDSIVEFSPDNGRRTLNEMRLANRVGQAHLGGPQVSVSYLSQLLRLPISTTSRTIAKLVADGWVEEHLDPDDYRRRMLRLTPETLERTYIWAEFAEKKRQRLIDDGLPIGVRYLVK